MSNERLTEGDVGNAVGKVINTGAGFGKPMGSWTGLPPSLGAPLSGALWGAGLGGLYAGGSSLVDWIRGRKRPPVPWWQNPILLGAAGGTGIGGLSAAFQNAPQEAPKLEKANSVGKHASEADQILQVILRDPNISDADRFRLAAAVRSANPGQLQRLLSAALTGTLTAGVAYKILGLSGMGSLLLGGLAGLFQHNFMSGPNLYQ